jgi:hypothetical protein
LTEQLQGPIGLIAEARVRWLSALPATAPLPERTIVVGNEATAHACRREIIDVRPDLLLFTANGSLAWLP